MNRRTLFLGAGGSIISSALQAKTQMIGPITQVFVETPARIEQHCPEWCWAASTAMIFAMNQHPLDQERIIQRVFGGMPCTVGNSSVMTKLLSDRWTDNNGTEFKSKIVASYDIFNNIIAIDNNIIVNELAANRPLLYAQQTTRNGGRDCKILFDPGGT